ncbi:MAG: DUF2249 domain-containing protein [Burkholderiaceae bacterium]|nr:DUF2249 domain-containing protein [Burkholderiaceae bacterium]
MNEPTGCGCGGGGGGCAGGADAGATSGARARRWGDADGEHIDVRGLSAPMPMVAILRLLEEIGAAPRTVIAHLDRDPLMLYPELAQRGWGAQLLPQAADQGVRLCLQRERAPS